VLVGFATLVGFNWGMTEFLPRMLPRLFARFTRELLAVIVGVVSGPIAVYVNLVNVGDVDGVRAYVAGAFIGIVGTVLAGGIHDYLVKPVIGGKPS